MYNYKDGPDQILSLVIHNSRAAFIETFGFWIFKQFEFIQNINYLSYSNILSYLINFRNIE